MAYKLLIPGPVDMEDEVLSALGSQAVPHYGLEWARMWHETIDGLKQIFGTQGDVYPIVGSGSAGLDAAIGTMFTAGQRIAIVRNGYFGTRLYDIATAYGLEVISIECSWGRAVSVDAVRAVLDEAGHCDGIALVHAETSTGVLNPVAEIAALAQERGIPIIVDAITAIGGSSLCIDDWGVDICVGASQKALAAPAGFALVAVSQKGWRAIDAQPSRPGSWYLNLRTWRRYAHEDAEYHPHPVTIPTSAMRALNLRIRQIIAQGIDAQLERYAQAAHRFRSGAHQLGLQTLVPESEAVKVVTPVIVPQGVDAAQAVLGLRERHGLLTSGGLGELHGRIIRIGHMGKAASDEYVDAALRGLADVLLDN